MSSGQDTRAGALKEAPDTTTNRPPPPPPPSPSTPPGWTGSTHALGQPALAGLRQRIRAPLRALSRQPGRAAWVAAGLVLLSLLLGAAGGAHMATGGSRLTAALLLLLGGLCAAALAGLVQALLSAQADLAASAPASAGASEASDGARPRTPPPRAVRRTRARDSGLGPLADALQQADRERSFDAAEAPSPLEQRAPPSDDGPWAGASPSAGRAAVATEGIAGPRALATEAGAVDRATQAAPVPVSSLAEALVPPVRLEPLPAINARIHALEAALRDLQHLVDAVPSLLGYWDRGLVARVANQAYHDWFGLPPGTLVGQHLEQVLGEAGLAASRPLFEAVLAGQAQRFERSVIDPDSGTPRHWLGHYLPDVAEGLHEPHGAGGREVRGFFVLVHEVTELIDSRQRLAAAVRDNDALLRTIHQHAIVSVTDRRGRIIEVNERFCQLFGHGREELLGQTHRVVNSGLHPPSFWAAMWGEIASGRPWRGEICNRARDGSLRWLDSIIAPFFAADGRTEKYISIRTDVTEAKRAEQALRASEAFLDRAGRIAGVGGWAYDPASEELVWSAQTYRLHEVDRSVRPTLAMALGFHPGEARATLQRAFDTALAEGRGWDLELPLVTAQGRSIWVRSVGTAERMATSAGTAGHGLAPHAGGVRLVGALQDVTLRKQAERRLLATGGLLRSVLDAASQVSIVATDAELAVTVFNAGAEQLLGYEAREVVGRLSLLDLLDPAELQGRAAERAARLGHAIDPAQALVGATQLQQAQAWTYRRRDGRGVAVSQVVTAMHADGGGLLGYLAVAHDVTRQRQYEDSLREARRKAEQASLAKSEFLANMSHEIRTPMNAVLGLSYLLGRTQLDTEQQDLLARMGAASKSLLALINDILDISKIEAGELQLDDAPFDLRALLAELRQFMAVQADAKAIGFEILSEGELPEALQGDVVRLQQILTNLLSNAIKFTQRGGVRLRVQRLAEDALAASGNGRGPAPMGGPGRVALRFSVTDTGIGIAPEVQARLFTPFAQADTSITRRFGGTGLGLSIVKRLVDLMGGEVSLHSVPGQGSEFTVTLAFQPARGIDPPRRSASPLPQAGARALPGVHVLVVDDSDVNLDVTRHILQLEGARVSLASDGAQALEILRRQVRTDGAVDGPAAPGQPAIDPIDIVLMDVQMPVLDGVDATRRLRAELALATLPVIALTAGGLSSERQRAAEAGMNDFVVKPFVAREMIACMLRHLHRAPGGGAAATVAGQAPQTGPGPGWPISTGFDGSEGSRPMATTGAVEDTPWPEVAGIDIADARARLNGDRKLFFTILRRLVDEFLPVEVPDVAPAEGSAEVPAEAAVEAPIERPIETPPARSAVGDAPDRATGGTTAATDEPSASAALDHAWRAFTGRMHKLRGSAGMLGATRIQQLAGEAEDASRAGDRTRASHFAGRLAAELAHLREAAADILQQQAAERGEALPLADGSSLDPAELDQLATLLRQQSLAAIEAFDRLVPRLHARLGSERLHAWHALVHNLRFGDAVALLDEWRTEAALSGS